jgi:phytanoyl-CoA hydroxylase
MTSSTVVVGLGGDELAHYEANGYLLVSELATASFLDGVEQLLEAIVEESIAAWRREGRISNSYRDLAFSKRYHHAWRAAGRPQLRTTFDQRFSLAVIGEFLSHGWLVESAAALLGCDAVRALDTCFYRAKFPDDETTNHPWHQDAQCMQPISGVDFVTVWIPLGDVSLESSCLWVSPTAERTTLPPAYAPSIEYVCMRESDAASLRRAQPLPMLRGDVLFMSPFLPHRSLGNTSSHTRWSVDFRYAPIR